VKKDALLVGYARVSKAHDQDTAAQVKALHQAGCQRIFEAKASVAAGTGRNFVIPEGDTLVVWKLDRLSRSLKDLLHIVERVRASAPASEASPRRLIPQLLRAGSIHLPEGLGR
jgi:DNA invertase Pin-like site-specific DNA recombinase